MTSPSSPPGWSSPSSPARGALPPLLLLMILGQAAALSVASSAGSPSIISSIGSGINNSVGIIDGSANGRSNTTNTDEDFSISNITVTTGDDINITTSSNDSSTTTGVKGGPLNQRPIIGILSQEPGRLMTRALLKQGLNFTSYIAASYVKSVEGAGARVVPILINQPAEYYQRLAGSLNGFLFPGGSAKINNGSGYGRAGDAIYQLVLAANSKGRQMPLWATCLGFEMLVYLAGARVNPLTGCRAQDRADPLYLQPGWKESRLWSTASPDLMEAVQQQNITSNFHKFCVTPQTFYNLSVDQDYKLLSTNFDDNHTEYVSTIEHRQYPIFGTQWHPEKNSYEWKNSTIPHTPEAVRLEHHVMEVFVDQARRNLNRFSTVEEEEQHLIYNYSPIYIAKLYPSAFQQCYYF